MKIPHTLKSATVLSLLVHLLFGAALAAVLARRPPITFGEGPLPAPMVLTLRQPEKSAPQPDPVIQMVESPVEAERPPELRDLISDVNSQAADQTSTAEPDTGPAPDIVDDLASLATLATRMTPPETPPQEPVPPAEEAQPEPEPEPEAAPEAKAPAPPIEEKAVPESPKRKSLPVSRPPESSAQPAKPVKAEALAKPAKESDSTAPPQTAEEEKAKSELEPFKMAMADTPRLAPEGMQEKTRGKVGDAELGEGFTSFDAIRDEIAPYLKLIKRNVEKRWNEEILTRYEGHMPTEATVDCVISPEGNVISVEVVGLAKDQLYAALCKRALERAGPFGPFPFKVPDMYRSKNLEIRWTFSFLRK